MNIQAQQLLQQGVTDGVYPGAALLVAKAGRILFQGEVGQAVAEPEPIDVRPDTLWDIASLTKPIAVSTALLSMVQNEGLDLRRAQVVDGLSLFDLLHHTAGLVAWVDYTQRIPPEISNKNAVKQWVEAEILKRPRRAAANRDREPTLYSDLGFILLGFWIEKTTGIDLDAYFSEHVAAPLGLTRSVYRPLDKGIAKERIAAGHRSRFRKRIAWGEVDDDNCALLGGVSGHAGLFSHVTDIHRFLDEIRLALAGKGKLFKRDTLLPLATEKPPFGRFHLGFDTPSAIASQAGTRFSPRTIGHLAFTGCSFWLDLETGWEVIFLSNRVHPDPENDKIKRFRPYLHDELAKIFLG